MTCIGIDFDNTIACYSDVFYKAALERGLIPSHISPSKGHVRDYLRSIKKEEEWTELQGYVYGKRMDLAYHFPEADLFFRLCREKNFSAFIISHKTLHPYKGPAYDLHQAAKDWLKKQDFFPLVKNTYFELTLPQKLERIETLSCDFFIDDLPELLLEKAFPKKTARILFDPEDQHENHPQYLRLKSWRDIHAFFSSLS